MLLVQILHSHDLMVELAVEPLLLACHVGEGKVAPVHGHGHGGRPAISFRFSFSLALRGRDRLLLIANLSLLPCK